VIPDKLPSPPGVRVRPLVLVPHLVACENSVTVDDAVAKDPPGGGDSGEEIVPADTSEGSFVGTIDGLNTYGGQETPCGGEATLTIDAEGGLDG
jgi:hypothetical protein